MNLQVRLSVLLVGIICIKLRDVAGDNIRINRHNYIYSQFVRIFVLSIYDEARSSFLRFAYIRYNTYNTNNLHWEYGHRQLV